MDVVDLEGHVLGPTVGTGPAPLLQEIFPDLVSGQGSLLVFDSGDLRVFDLLHVEPDQLLGQFGNGNQSPEPFDPGEGRVDPMAQARGQPAVRTCPVVEPGRPVAKLTSPPSPEGPALVQFLFDGGSPVMNLRLKQDMGGLLPVRLFLPDHGESGGLRSGIEFDPNGLGFAPDPVLQPDGERGDPVNHRPSLSQKLPSPGRVAGHQGLLFLVEHKNLHESSVEPYVALALRP